MSLNADEKKGYHSHCREDLLNHMPRKRATTLLEIGAGTGETLLKAKELGVADFVIGVEISSLPQSNQTNPDIDRFFIGNIENMELDVKEGSCDVIICGDVLEHLIDPWKCASRLRTYLKEDGLIIASIPNARYWRVSTGLLFAGRWNYGDAGILDRTHLRFFTRETTIRLFEEAGYVLRTVERQGPQRKWGLAKWAVNLLTLGFFSELLTVQHIIVASKSAATGS